MSLGVHPREIVAAVEPSEGPSLLGRAGHWDRVDLGEIARVVNGAAFPSSGFNREGRGLPLIRIRDVGNDNTATWFDGDWDRQHLVEHGDLLVGMDGDFRVARWRGPSALLNQRVCRVDVDESAFDKSFLELVLQGYLDAIWEATSSVTVKHLSSRTVQQIPLPRPDLREQRRIVEFLEDQLSRLDAAVVSLGKAQKRLVSFERSLLDRHFGGAEVPLADLVEEISSGKSFGVAAAPATDDEWGIIKVSAMTWGEFRPAENKAVSGPRVDPRYEIREGDLLVSRANTEAYVGAAVLVGPVRPKLLLSDKSLRIAPRPGVDPEWLCRALQAPTARRQISVRSTGTKESMRNISQAALLSVSVPSRDGTNQARDVAAFEESRARVDAAQLTVQSQRARERGLRRALLAAAFSGQLTGRDSDLEHAAKLVGA